MAEILTIGVAAWMVYEAIRAVIAVPAWLQPIVVVAVCYGLAYVPPIALTCLNAAAVVAALRMITDLLRPSSGVQRPSLRTTQRRGTLPDLP